MKKEYLKPLVSVTLLVLIMGFTLYEPGLLLKPQFANNQTGPEQDGKKSPLIYINTYIENGSKLNWEIKDDGIVYLDLPYDYERRTLNRAFDHLHFILEAPTNSDITLIFQNFNEIYNGSPVAFRDWITDVVISKDGRKWQHPIMPTVPLKPGYCSCRGKPRPALKYVPYGWLENLIRPTPELWHSNPLWHWV
ncbi:MAG: hypothetical protein HGA23_08600, partial [Bacteroidales bacterium]|nr:hypothetical protein [Bacteroidales bacterium]